MLQKAVSNLHKLLEVQKFNVLSVLYNIHPRKIFYMEIGEDIKITIKKKRNEKTLNNDKLSVLKWMAPETIQNGSKPVSCHSANSSFD